ncbi:hypothetical protein GWI33_007090 [Rhynchophorus ferrugineus]|uniref:Ig-like domain-containing protein n=1 Tax=Rhynchophorus ferrugineus TaxID=354439 RepID=A0A834MD88_RHYFE|nr:hypothetical protein GWI33_007090 [Rhynchophorus ferrugineus]
MNSPFCRLLLGGFFFLLLRAPRPPHVDISGLTPPPPARRARASRIIKLPAGRPVSGLLLPCPDVPGFPTSSSALRDVIIKVPEAAVRGRDATLECSFDLEGESLYSLKWYHNGHEFYRYTPSERTPVRVYPENGININEQESTERQIVLHNVSREMSGQFSCEVTADKPSFFMAMQTEELRVVDLPKKDPYLSGFKHRYYLMEDKTFHANCTSEDSYPAVNITWYINDIPIRPPHVRKHQFHRGDLLVVVSSLRHHLTKKFVSNGSMRVKCTANLYDVYVRSTEVDISLFKKRRKNHHPDYFPLSTAPPPRTEDLSYDFSDYSTRESTNTILSFFSSAPTPKSLKILIAFLSVTMCIRNSR